MAAVGHRSPNSQVCASSLERHRQIERGTRRQSEAPQRDRKALGGRASHISLGRGVRGALQLGRQSVEAVAMTSAYVSGRRSGAVVTV